MEKEIETILYNILGISVDDYNYEYQFESIMFVELIEQLETHFKFKIPICDVRESNFNSVNNICAYIKEKEKLKYEK